jgi:hypothetical protein
VFTPEGEQRGEPFALGDKVNFKGPSSPLGANSCCKKLVGNLKKVMKKQRQIGYVEI